MATLEFVFSINCYTCCVLAVSFNALVLLFTITKSTAAISELKWFLANLAISNTLLSVDLMLLQPQQIIRGSSVIVISKGPISRFETTVLVRILLFWMLGTVLYT